MNDVILTNDIIKIFTNIVLKNSNKVLEIEGFLSYWSYESKLGKFDSKEIVATSRTTTGIKGITLNKDDYIVSALPVRNSNDNLAIFTNNGLCKKLKLDELPMQKRAGKGLMCYKPTDSTGYITGAALVDDTDNILILGDKNSICISAQEIPLLSRTSIGNQVIKNSKINSVSKV